MCLVCLSNRKRLHCSEVYIVCDTVFQSEAQSSFTHEQLMFSASLNSLIHNEHSGIVIIQCGLILLGVQGRSKKDSRTVMTFSAIFDFFVYYFCALVLGFTFNIITKSNAILWTAITGSFNNMLFT